MTSQYFYIASGECTHIQNTAPSTDTYRVCLPHEIKLDPESQYELALVECELQTDLKLVGQRTLGAFLSCNLVKSSFIEEDYMGFLRKLIFDMDQRYFEFNDRYYFELLAGLDSIKIFDLYITSCDLNHAPVAVDLFYLLFHLRKKIP